VEERGTGTAVATTSPGASDRRARGIDRRALAQQDRELRIALLIAAMASLAGVLFALGSRSPATTRIVIASQILLVLAGVVLFLVLRTRKRLHHAVLALDEGEQRFSAIVGSSVDVIAVLAPNGHLTYASPSAFRMLGYTEVDLLGRNIAELLHPEDVQDAVDGLSDLSDPAAPREPRRLRISDSSGEFRHVEVIGSNMVDDPVIQGYVFNVRDISERIRAEADLMESEERFRSAFDAAPTGMALVAPDGKFVQVNHALCEMLGHDEDHLLACRAFDLVHPEEQVAAAEILARMEEGSVTLHRAETRLMRSDGRVMWAIHTSSAVRSAEGRFLYSTDQVMDVTEQRETAERLAHQALHDPLTGLPNRVLFLDRLGHALERTERTGLQVAVLFLDLDRFKVVNDSLGHGAGDQLLVEVAHRLRTVVRPLDTVARFGGDEFTILLEDVPDEGQATTIAERIGVSISEPFDLSDSEVFVNTSIGIALGSGAAQSSEGLVRDADAAMYRAKEKGRARYEVFDDRVRATVVERLSLESALHRALARGEFQLNYQPEVDLRTGKVVAVEALLRWRSQERGLLRPGQFISVAEETGLIVPIGSWALREACHQAKRWRDLQRSQATLDLANSEPLPMPTVWVNLSARQLAHPGLVDSVAEALAESRCDPGSICLEITESVLMGDAGSTIETLEALRDLGVRLGVDDFGTGYSSLVYLKRFPVDLLKIDRTFTDGLGREPDDTAIVTAVVGLAHSLGLTAVAEGVETADQVAALRTLGCDVGQGFFFSDPLSATEIDALWGAQLLGGFAPVVDLREDAQVPGGAADA
jgi:diguanylate cyclase (GGDEF)-like protein/PAS domain S-box-containing protein